MKRIASHFCFCSPDRILRRMVIEQDENYVVNRIFGLDEGNVESANTLFFDGILSAEVISLKEHTKFENPERIIKDYDYYDFSEVVPTTAIQRSNKSLLLDFGTNNCHAITEKLHLLTTFLCDYSVFEIIAACTYFPALVLKKQAELTAPICTKIILWENIDLIGKKITQHSSIREIE